tara:strand:- start:3444 stop:3632 length:189 start_codon:yes stop_codon:yes gene_type:complete
VDTATTVHGDIIRLIDSTSVRAHHVAATFRKATQTKPMTPSGSDALIDDQGAMPNISNKVNQ